MNNRYLTFRMIMLLIITPLAALSQNNTKVESIDYSTVYSGTVIDSATRKPIQSAVVYLMGIDKDNLITRSTVTDKKGKFEIKVTGPSKLEISCLGYKLYSQRVQQKDTFVKYYTDKFGYNKKDVSGNKFDLGVVRLAPDPYKLDEVVVKSRKQMFEQRGDTTRIFPRLARTMEGDALIEVLKMIPGFKVTDDGTIYEDGKIIERTYVNNELLFGNDPRTAFLKLTATSALAIDTYDEEVDEAERNLTNRKERKRRVANIRTAEELKRYTILELFAEGGVDHDKDRDGERHNRYGVKGSWNQYQVGRKLEFSAGTNNTVITSDFRGIAYKSGNPKETNLKFAFEKALGDSVYSVYANKKMYRPESKEIWGSYNFSDSRLSSESVSKSSYFPSSYFNSQLIEDKITSESKTQTHEAQIEYRNKVRMFSNGPSFLFKLQPKFSQVENFSYRNNLTTTDGNETSSVRNDNISKSDKLNIKGEFNIQKPILMDWMSKLKANSKKYIKMSSGITFMGTFHYAENNGNTLRNYELKDDVGTNLTNLTIDSDVPAFEGHISVVPSLSLQGNFDSKTFKNDMVDFRMFASGRYYKSKSQRLAINQATGLIDNAYSREVIENKKSVEIAPMLMKSWAKSIYSLSLSARIGLTQVQNDRHIPQDLFESKTFSEIGYDLSIRRGNNLSIQFVSYPRIPSLDQLSSVLDNNDPMNLSSGNPNLKSSNEYSVALNLNNRSRTKTRKVNINGSISGSITTNPIIMNRRYFSETTILPEYENYEAVAGARLYIPMNVGSHYSLKSNVSFSYLNQPSNTTINLAINGSWSNPLASIDNRILRNKNTNANVMLSINSTPSTKLRINIDNTTSFAWQHNDVFKDRSHNNFFQTKVRYDFLNRMTMTTTYKNDYQKSHTTGMLIRRNSMDISLGARIFRKRNGTLSANVYNLFNDKTGYSLNITDQYIAERWEQLFTRFYTISFQYKFNSIDHKKNR